MILYTIADSNVFSSYPLPEFLDAGYLVPGCSLSFQLEPLHEFDPLSDFDMTGGDEIPCKTAEQVVACLRSTSGCGSMGGCSPERSLLKIPRRCCWLVFRSQDARQLKP